MSGRRSAPLVGWRVMRRQLAQAYKRRSFAPEHERTFQRFHAEAVFGRARFGVALGFVAWVSFAVWDVLGFPSIGGRLIAIRLLLVAPILAWLWWRLAARPEACKSRLQKCLIIGPAAASAGLLSMLRTASATDSVQAFQMFWPAFCGLYFFLYAFLGLQFKPAALVGNLTFIAVLALASDSGVEVHILGSALFQLGLLNVIGMIVCARSEIQLRTSFRRRQHHGRLLATARRERINAQQARDDAMRQRVRAEAAMNLVEEERGKLALATEEKERFFAAAYHDLQQPLSIIGLYAHLAKSKLGGWTAPGVVSDLSIIEQAGYDIGLMFKGVRDTWEIGRTEPALAAVDIEALLLEIERELKERADQKGLTFRVHRSSRPSASALSDRTLLKRAVSNLVSNAIKYTEQGGLVLGAVCRKQRVRIDVRDTGIGIPTHLQSRIFEPYFQVSNPGRNRKLGLGLGLAIVRQIEQVLPDHRLDWCSRPGRGSCFSLDLPLADSTAPVAVAAPAATGLASETALLRGKYILVVEDDHAILQGTVAVLQRAGCLAEGAASAEAARTLLDTRDRCPDLLITDLRLEHGATGLDVVAALRQRFEWAAATPVLFVTGELTPTAALSGFEGPHGLHRKPIEYAELLRQVCGLLSSLSEPLLATLPQSADVCLNPGEGVQAGPIVAT